MSKLVSPEFAASLVKDGDTIGMGGFVGFGTPEELIIPVFSRPNRVLNRFSAIKGITMVTAWRQVMEGLVK